MNRGSADICLTNTETAERGAACCINARFYWIVILMPATDWCSALPHLLLELMYLCCGSFQSASISVQQLLVLRKPLQLLPQRRHFVSVLLLQGMHLIGLIS